MRNSPLRRNDPKRGRQLVYYSVHDGHISLILLCITLYYLYVTCILPLNYPILPPYYPYITVYYHILLHITVYYL